jgi:uncharacterized protein (DUF305 family)
MKAPLVRSAVLLASMAAASEVDIHAHDDGPHGESASRGTHHQGAIDMAQTELLYGRNEQLPRIAQEIIVEQCAEIAAMQREQALHQIRAGSAKAPRELIQVQIRGD